MRRKHIQAQNMSPVSNVCFYPCARHAPGPVAARLVAQEKSCSSDAEELGFLLRASVMGVEGKY